jgi:CRP/FNR family transcriptional regulator, cyclic AMP receptor protein
MGPCVINRDLSFIAEMVHTLEGVELMTYHVTGPPAYIRLHPPEAVFLLETGVAAIFLQRDGLPDIALSLIRAGELFGEDGLFAERRYAPVGGLLTTSTVAKIPKGPLLDKCKEHPEWAFDLARLAATRQAEWAVRIESILREAVGPRVVRSLVELADAFSFSPGQDGPARIPVTQSVLASLVGVTRESTSHKLNELERAGLVQLTRGAIEIPAVGRLRQSVPPLPSAAQV